MLIFTNFQIVPCTNVTEASNTGEGSLRNAIDCSTSNSTITFESNIDNITLTQPIDISKNIELDGSNTTLPTINGANVMNPYIFKINPNVNVTFKNLNILTNTTSNAIFNEGNLIINNVHILKN